MSKTFNKIRLLAALASTTIFNGLMAEAMVSSEIEAASKILGANLVDEVTFDEGRTSLSEQARAEIRSFVQDASQKGKIVEVRVAVWADKDYPTDSSQPRSSDIKLSAGRAKAMENYLTKDLALNNVSSYNMSEQPNPLQKMVGSREGGMNNEFIFTRVNKSKAVLMIYLR